MSVSKVSTTKVAQVKGQLVGDLTTDQLSALVTSAVIDALIVARRVEREERIQSGLLMTLDQVKAYLS